MSMEQPKLYMVCGISGSGKTFYAKKLEEKGVFRLSIDEELWPDFFLLDPLLSGEHRAVLKEQATARIKSRAANLAAEGRSVCIDMPFCKRSQREEFREYAKKIGAEPVLIYMKAELSALKERLAARKGKNGPNALFVSEEELMRYWNGFERPLSEENATVIEQEQPPCPGSY